MIWSNEEKRLLDLLIPGSIRQPSASLVIARNIGDSAIDREFLDLLKWAVSVGVKETSDVKDITRILNESSIERSRKFFYRLFDIYFSDAEIFSKIYDLDTPLAFAKINLEVVDPIALTKAMITGSRKKYRVPEEK